MCGIFGFVGEKNSIDITVEGLRRLEYRGYDSSGICFYDNHNFKIQKNIGTIDDMLRVFDPSQYYSNLSIGHTRWATHGKPSELNSHPHYSNDGTLSIVHNGIIENYDTLKIRLIDEGYEFYSETDSEVLVNWIHYVKKQNGCSLQESLKIVQKEIVGSYAILLMEKGSNLLIGTCKSSPLCIGYCEDGHAISSDTTSLLPLTKKISYLKDDQIFIIGKNNCEIFNNDLQKINSTIEELDIVLEDIEKGNYDSFMLKEIFEQPGKLKDCIRGRVTNGLSDIRLSGFDEIKGDIKRIIILGCGTSLHSAMVGKIIIENLCRVPVEVDHASEFRYRNPILFKDDLVIVISQSGESADTKSALEMIKERGIRTFGIVNSVGSSIARLCDSGIYTRSGVEIGVASTKAFTGQIISLLLFAIRLGRDTNKINDEDFKDLKRNLRSLPKKVEKLLDKKDQIFEIADKYSSKDYSFYMFLGRGINFPIALEGSLKLKEISYRYSEGYPAGEMKHGPIALIDEKCLSIFITPMDKSYDKVISNMAEIRSREGEIVSLVTKDDVLIPRLSDYVIEIDDIHDLFSPLITIIPLQLFAYRISTNLGLNVDKPRNLAKSVTVE